MNYTRIAMQPSGPTVFWWHHITNFTRTPIGIISSHGPRDVHSSRCTGFFWFQGNDVADFGAFMGRPQFILYEWDQTNLFGGALAPGVFWAQIVPVQFRIGTPRAEYVSYQSDFTTWLTNNTNP